MGTSKRKVKSKAKVSKGNNSRVKSKSEYQDVFNKLDGLQTNIKGEHKKISSPASNKSYQLIAVGIIIIVGMAGLVVLYNPNAILNPSSNHTTNSSIIASLGNFKEDTSVSAQPLIINKKLSIIYVGGEFCPYCAVERWALVMALSQYGTFSNLGQLISDEAKVPTYQFDGSTYTSNIIDFQPVDEYGNTYNSQTQQYNKINSLNSIQSTLFNKYAGGYFPFVCIGGAIYQVGAGPNLSPTDFNKYSFNQIQSQISSKTGLYSVINAESAIIISLINEMLATISSSTSATSSNATFAM